MISAADASLNKYFRLLHHFRKVYIDIFASEHSPSAAASLHLRRSEMPVLIKRETSRESDRVIGYHDAR